MNFDAVKKGALVNIEAVLQRWAPGGKRRGREYLCLNPRRADREIGSFSINLDTGAWGDFATDDKGGDVVSFVAHIDRTTQTEAAESLATFLGFNFESKASAPKKTAPWRPVLPVPASAPLPPRSHPKHGTPSRSWEYRDPDSKLLCVVCRFEPKTKGERKQFAPLSYCRKDGTNTEEWRWQGLTEPRPLYGLNRLAAMPEATVVVVEGEKSADAITALFSDAVGITMLNGAQSPHKTDWSPLKGRHVLLWPDHDEPGRVCMAKVAVLVAKAGAASANRLNIAVFAHMPGTDDDGKPTLVDGSMPPEKWDAADALLGGWTAAHVAMLRARPDFLLDTETAESAQTIAPTTPAPETRQSLFHCNDDGVWYFGKNDTGTDAPPLWLCSPLRVTAYTRDARNQAWGRLLEFDDLDGQHHVWSLPMEMLKGDGAEYRGELLSQGLLMAPAPKARHLITQYIQTAPVPISARCVERTGWHGNVFVMHDRTIGEGVERLIFQSSNTAPGAFKQKGALSDWQKSVAAPCVGNSRLVFAISTAFAVTLLNVTGMESGGFHFRGNSSTGKTTALRAAASVWGGADYLQRWRATDNGLEALAAQHSDCLLVLDELSQVDPRAVGEVAYMLANGSGKARANRGGGMRETASWQLLFLSSGEAGLAEHMLIANRKSKAGMEIRLLDIPADAGLGLGIFEALHGHATAAAFSRAITEAALSSYGTAARAFISKVIEHLERLPRVVKEAQKDFTAKNLPADAGGQAHRAALRFALVGAAGELATAFEVTSWPRGEAMAAAEKCFNAWLAQRGGAGNSEIAAMLSQVRGFFELHGDARFVDWERATDDHAPKTISRAGFRKYRDEIDEVGQPVYDDGTRSREIEFYVLPEIFRTEICRGFDHKAVAHLLAERGYLLKEGQSFTRKERLPGVGNARCYRITPNLLLGCADE